MSTSLSSATPASGGRRRRRRSGGGTGAERAPQAASAQASPRTAATEPQRAGRRPAAAPAHTAEPVVPPGTTAQPDARSFAELGLPDPLLRSLAAAGIATPFPIQAATLPDTLAGRDVLGRGRTGSGKTLAFSLPIVARLASAGRNGTRRPGRPRALVLAPTRELASQIDATLAPLAAAMGLNTTVIFGGVTQSRQVTALNAGVDVVVACPGRLEDLLGQRALTLDDVQVTVLDEADHMADLGFLPGVKRILDRTPAGGQRLLFSATLDNGVDQLVARYLVDPLRHSVDSAESPVAAMTHHVLAVRDADAKKEVVRQLASGTGRRVLFTRTKHQAKKLAKQLTTAGVPAVDLHGNLSQPARERNLEAFSSGTVKVLVATDIAARGIHVDDVELVVHVDPPAEHKAYLHRSGRTARAGAEGAVVTVMLPEQRDDVRVLTRQARIDVTPTPVTPGDATVSALRGEAAPAVTPVAQPAASTAPARRSGQPAGPTRSVAEAVATQRSEGGGRSRGRRGRGGSGRGSTGAAATGHAGTSRASAPTSSRPAGQSPRQTAQGAGSGEPARRPATADTSGRQAGSAATVASRRGRRASSRPAGAPQHPAG